MLLISSYVFLVLSDPAPPILRRTDPGVPPFDVLSCELVSEEGGHSCLGCAPGSNLELGRPLLPLSVTALGFEYFLSPALPDLAAWFSGSYLSAEEMCWSNS